MKKTSTTNTIVLIALFIALEVILTRFLSINLPFARIGFGFLPIAVVAIRFGPAWAGVTYMVGDLIGAMLFPSGPFFPGFTLTALLTGITYGLILYKKEITWKRVSVAVLVVIVLYTLVLNTLWLNILYGQAFLGLLPGRLIQGAIMIPVQVISITLVWKKIGARLL